MESRFTRWVLILQIQRCLGSYTEPYIHCSICRKYNMRRWLPILGFFALLYYFGLFGCGWSDFSAELCGGYCVYATSAHQIHVSPSSWNSETERIPVKVVELGHDSRFIIAKQNRLRRRYPNDPGRTYMEPDPGVYSYWILDTSIPKAYGPLTKDEFDKRRIELSVPNELELKNVYSYAK